ncbi:MAG TPA: Stp1/IreP family PP2C-type Ser/Thr phosphatase, partial [Sandaracinaceae bacterium LLY-WYZ-13_1]|nr:Stp1/IreP family PP2C-type Ser/Thr phosphatase [Sandaracinaceae bacterium LLY-WYZ-13_1]
GEPAPAPASEQPARADTPAPASEPAAAEEPAPASEPAAVEEPAPASEEPAKADAPAPPSDEPTEPEARAEDETIRHSTEGVAGASGPIEVRYFGRTDVGLVREHNEDNFLVADLEADVRDSSEPREVTVGAGGCIFAVCDGMGGAAAGEVASQMAVDTIYEVLDGTGPPEDRDEFARRLVRSIEEAGHRIFSAAKMDRTRRGMGTTATLAGLVDDVLFVGQVGDSRAYVLRGDQLEMITKDQSLVNQLIEAGQLTEEEAEAFEHSNIILQALGTTEEVTVDLTFLEMRKGDRLMMCSDGLSGLVHAEMIKEVMQETSDLTECADKLIQMANAGGGHDNITVILADFDGAGLKEAEGAKVVYQQYPLPLDERGRGDSVPPRETSIKTGGPKPGADVKRDDHGAAATDAAVPSEGGGSKMWLVLLLLVGLVALLAGGYLVMNGALGAGDADVESADPPPPPPPVDEPETLPVEPTEPEGDPAGAAGEGEAAAAEEVATITIQTDVEGGTLHVNGQPHGPLTDGMTLDLAPGAYTFEAHLGDSTSAEAEPVSVNAGDAITVQLTMPTGESDAPEPEEEPAPAGAE